MVILTYFYYLFIISNFYRNIYTGGGGVPQKIAITAINAISLNSKGLALPYFFPRFKKTTLDFIFYC